MPRLYPPGIDPAMLMGHGIYRGVAFLLERGWAQFPDNETPDRENLP
jgi:hypothetical protein